MANTVNLTGFRVTMETKPLGLSVRDILDYVNWGGKIHLKCGSTIPWAGVLDRIKRAKGIKQMSSSFSPSWLQLPCDHPLFAHAAISVIMDGNLKLWAKTNSCFLQFSCYSFFLMHQDKRHWKVDSFLQSTWPVLLKSSGWEWCGRIWNFGLEKL